MTNHVQNHFARLNYPALLEWVDAAGVGDHDHLVKLAARQVVEQHTSLPAEAIRVVGAVEDLDGVHLYEERHSSCRIVTIEANGIIHRVCIYVENKEVSAMMLLGQRFTNDAACVVAMALGCLPTDVRLTATTSAEHVDIAVSTPSVDFRATHVRRDIPSVLSALKPTLGQTLASRHLLVNDRP